jgi:hypothetical protein
MDRNVRTKNIRRRNIYSGIITHRIVVVEPSTHQKRERAINTEPGLEYTIGRLISRACDLEHKRVHALLKELGLYPGNRSCCLLYGIKLA